MNFSFPFSGTRFSNGDAKVRFIFDSPNFFATFLKKFFKPSFSVSLVVELSTLSAPVFRLGLQR